MVETSSDNKHHLTGLNGLRIIAALLLLSGHVSQQYFASWKVSVVPFMPEGALTLFFVLSGFLASYTQYGNVNFSIRKYYRKKILRILPVYYVYIAVVAAVFLLQEKSNEILCGQLVYYVIPLGNIPFCAGNAICPLAHLWYIGAIVQFFLVYPWIAKAAKKNLGNWSFAICALWFLLKVSLYMFAKDGVTYRLVANSQFDNLFLGVWIGTLVRDGNRVVGWLQNSKSVFAITWILFLLSGLHTSHIPSVVRNEFLAVIMVLLILGQISQRSIFCLENKVFNFLGEISYGIYVWHILVIILLSELHAMLGFDLPDAFIYLAVASVTVAVAFVSYKCVEKPCCRLFK